MNEYVKLVEKILSDKEKLGNTIISIINKHAKPFQGVDTDAIIQSLRKSFPEKEFPIMTDDYIREVIDEVINKKTTR